MKHFSTFLLLLLISISSKAQLAYSDIDYWVGNGQDSALFVVDFNDNSSQEAWAWGVKFDTEISGGEIIEMIAAKDKRFSADAGSFLNSITFDGQSGTGGDNNYYWATFDGNDLASLVSNEGLGATILDGQVFATSFTDFPAPEYDPRLLPENPATVSEPSPFDFSDVEFWIGQGSDSAMLVIDFNDGTLTESFAWGYRFDGTITGLDMIEDIDAVDTLLQIVGGNFVDSIGYKTHAGKNGTNEFYWGTFSGTSIATMVANSGTGTEVANRDWFALSFTTFPGPDFIPAYPPSEPVAAEFLDVDTAPNDNTSEGIDRESADIVAWATGASVTRGPIDISDPSKEDQGSSLASYGVESEATGMAEGDGTSVVSLGDGGTAVLTFENPVTNGEGPDFAVFENSFSPTFLELAFVEVSSDGVNYFRFPAVSRTQTSEQIGNGGELNPDSLSLFAGLHIAGKGTPFDLDSLPDDPLLDKTEITHVKIIDVVGSIDPQYGTYDSKENIVNDPFPTPFWSCGFDLDGVGVIHQKITTGFFTMKKVVAMNAYPNPASDFTTVSIATPVKAVAISQQGISRNVDFEVNDGQTRLNLSDLNKGMYLIVIHTNDNTFQTRIFLD